MPKKRKKDPKRGAPDEKLGTAPSGESPVESKPAEDASIEAAPRRGQGEPKGFPPPPGSTKGYDNPAQGLV